MQELGKLDEAIISYRKAIEINSNSCWLYASLGEVHIKQKKWSDAVECFRQAIQIKPDYDKAYEKIAYVFEKLGDSEAAEKCRNEYQLLYSEKNKFAN